jgi:hypothetical protein
MKTLALVACVAQKLDRPAPARELYTSPWFIKARDYVEGQGYAWRVLSALHGLVEPERVLDPYNLTLDRLSPKLRLLWALGVLRQIDKLPRPERVVILAGRRYREHLAVELLDRGYVVEVPMAGLGIGEQLQWLKEHTK